MMGAGKAAAFAIAVLTLVSAATNAADTTVDLQRNPFERPVLEAVNVNAASSSNSADATDAPGLRAVLVAGSKSAVNFGGIIIQIGESANGYQLLAVEEGRAVFRNKGKEVVFSLYEQDEGSTL